MKTKIKMCGLRRSEDIAYANEVKPEYIGLVFAKKSKRYITPEQAAEIVNVLDADIIPVGVFVDSDYNEIRRIYDLGAIKAAQLHGDEPDELIRKLQDTDIKVIRAFRVKSEADVEKAEKSPADYVLLDSGQGSGETFDWSLIKKIKRPYFLAGGLDTENVKQAVEELHPFAVDVSSGIETNGFKDGVKMTKFASSVRNK